MGKHDNAGIVHANDNDSCGRHVYNETIPLFNNEYHLIGEFYNNLH